uniref:(California timema) hypothetical protein n=1 Tax=Timema californicum TaxID=61474 RepID=A0A7R9IZJ2_TIMCA|nr:unnamed protein product [Timema californicum]
MNKLANARVVLSSTAEDGEIKVRISVVAAATPISSRAPSAPGGRVKAKQQKAPPKETTIKQQDVKEPPPRVDPPVDPVNGVVQPPVLPAPDRPGRVKMYSRFYGNINLLGLSTNLLTPRNLIFRYVSKLYFFEKQIWQFCLHSLSFRHHLVPPTATQVAGTRSYLPPRLGLPGFYPGFHRNTLPELSCFCFMYDNGVDGLNLAQGVQRDYHKIIKQPMDLGTVKKRLEHNYYWSSKECIQDFNTMFTNCYVYNKPGEDVVVMAQTLEKLFLTKVAQMQKEEVELEPPVPKGPKGKKVRTLVGGVAGRGRPSTGGATTVTSSVPNAVGTSPGAAVQPPPTPVATTTGSAHLPLGTQPPTTVPGSTATTTVPTPTLSHGTHNSLPKQVAAPTGGYHAQPALMSQSIDGPLPASSAVHSQNVPPPVIPPAQPAKSKKGVKRKADTTTPTANAFDPLFTPAEAKSAKISTRRESGRQIKKINKGMPSFPGKDKGIMQTYYWPFQPQRQTEDGLPFHQAVHPLMTASLSNQPQHSGAKPKDKLNDSLKACNEILKELFSKKHSGYAWPFYKPVDAELLGLHDYHDIIKKPMDLGTVKQKMDTREYKSAGEFAADVRLIFTNCYKYNPPDHDVVAMARKLQDVFEMR